MIEQCIKLRKKILEISKVSGHGHIPTCFSVIEMIYSVYDTMKHNPNDPLWGDRDIFILSKGHAALAHYSILAHFGYFDIEGLKTFGHFQSQFGCHGDRFKVPGIEASTGSLGHGIGVAVGIALALKLKNTEKKVYVLIGDGEANEGSVWEAVMVAVNLKLDNITILYDNNMSHARGLQIHNPAERLASFGCSVFEVDGHNIDELKSALLAITNGVKVVVANTKKGCGCKELIENHYAWHRRAPSEEEFKMLCEELDEKAV